MQNTGDNQSEGPAKKLKAIDNRDNQSEGPAKKFKAIDDRDNQSEGSSKKLKDIDDSDNQSPGSVKRSKPIDDRDNQSEGSAKRLKTIDDQPTGPAKKLKTIDDQRAQKLIYEKELAPWGRSQNIARDAIMNIREVSVDEMIGPDVRQTLLRNLNHKMSTSSASKAKKTPQDRLAKQKHQITHLAQVALAQEEKMKNKWADDKAIRTSAAKRYGFR